MTALVKFPRGTGAPAVPRLVLAACGGGGGGGPQFAGIDANSILVSDARLRLADGRQVRVSDVSRIPSGSRELTVDGETVPFRVGDDGSDAAGTAKVYGTRGDRNDFGAVAVHECDDGFTARYAAAGGVAYPDSLPLTGSATWRGDTVGLDGDNRVVRGAAVRVFVETAAPRPENVIGPAPLGVRALRRRRVVRAIYLVLDPEVQIAGMLRPERDRVALPCDRHRRPLLAGRGPEHPDLRRPGIDRPGRLAIAGEDSRHRVRPEDRGVRQAPCAADAGRQRFAFP